jgi:hypothetical protein
MSSWLWDSDLYGQGKTDKHVAAAFRREMLRAESSGSQAYIAQVRTILRKFISLSSEQIRIRATYCCLSTCRPKTTSRHRSSTWVPVQRRQVPRTDDCDNGRAKHQSEPHSRGQTTSAASTPRPSSTSSRCSQSTRALAPQRTTSPLRAKTSSTASALLPQRPPRPTTPPAASGRSHPPPPPPPLLPPLPPRAAASSAPRGWPGAPHATVAVRQHPTEL